jgi:hypothetical protein
VIQVEKIHIEEFRGIRHLELKFNGKPFVVSGPNGSGKSGVVDAIDFSLTGNIARLSGAGTGGLSVLKHGPHIHRRDDPGAAKVTLTLRDPATGKTAVLTRCVKTANTYTLDPDLQDVRAAVDHAGAHPELTLSRRQIIDFILTEPTARAKRIQALLKLDRLDETRALLRTAQTKTSTAENTRKAEVSSAEDELRRHLDLPELITAQLVDVVNKRRAVLGLADLRDLEDDTDLSGGLVREPSGAAFDKASATRDVAALQEQANADTSDLTADLAQTLDEMAAEPSLLDLLHQRSLVQSGLGMVRDARCPLCDLEWADEHALREHLAEKLQRSQAAAELDGRLRADAQRLRTQSANLRAIIKTVATHADRLGVARAIAELRTWSDNLVALEAQLGTIEGAAEARPRLSQRAFQPLEPVLAALDEIRTSINRMPDHSAAEEARDFLLIAQDRWKRVQGTRRTFARAAAAKSAAAAVYSTYCATADSVLEDLYDTVEGTFAAYYRFINSDDESTFKAELTPSSGKLELKVDFYGLGMFPPAAYHSEGHQDGMGVCLYLALMRQLLGDDFRFAVLDDVVMSVDRDHRRQFCVLLKTEFPNVQFVITTHEEIWARQMETEGLVNRTGRARFRSWSVDYGPEYEQDDDAWTRIQYDLDHDDLPGAAHKLRRHMEATLNDLADALAAKVHFRADNRYDLGEFYGAVNARYGELLKRARSSATSWNDDGAVQQIDTLIAARQAAAADQSREAWAINLLVHYNSDTTLSKQDFIKAVEACRSFLAVFTCDNENCESPIRLVGSPGNEDALRCDCSRYNFNLRRQ